MEHWGQDARANFIASFHLPAALARAPFLRAVELGYAPAQAIHASHLCGKERLEWAQLVAAQGEREGLFQVGLCLLGCARDWAAAEAGAMGHSYALFSWAAEALEAADARRYEWWGRAAARGVHRARTELVQAAQRVANLQESGAPGRIMYGVGCGCKGHLNSARQSAFGVQVGRNEFEQLRAAVAVCDRWNEAARAAVRCWTGAGRRLGVARDVRLPIARLVWKQRRAWH